MSFSEEYMEHLKQVKEELGLDFQDDELLFQALVHDSYIYENEGMKWSNERLEFLGDSVLGLAISHKLYTLYPEWTEGELALYKSKLVSADSLAEKARCAGLGRCLFLGRGEEANGGRNRTSILSDGLEALIGAIYIDGGFAKAAEFIDNLFCGCFGDISPIKDYKSCLQEYSQKYYKSLPVYQVIEEEGPPHKKIFHVKVHTGGNASGIGDGLSKKEAEQNAACNLLSKIGRRQDQQPAESEEE